MRSRTDGAITRTLERNSRALYDVIILLAYLKGYLQENSSFHQMLLVLYVVFSSHHYDR